MYERERSPEGEATEAHTQVHSRARETRERETFFLSHKHLSSRNFSLLVVVPPRFPDAPLHPSPARLLCGPCPPPASPRPLPGGLGRAAERRAPFAPRGFMSASERPPSLTAPSIQTTLATKSAEEMTAEIETLRSLPTVRSGEKTVAKHRGRESCSRESVSTSCLRVPVHRVSPLAG